MKKGKWFPAWMRSIEVYQITSSDKLTVTCCTNNVGQTGQRKLTFNLEFPGNLWLAAFAILSMFHSSSFSNLTLKMWIRWSRWVWQYGNPAWCDFDLLKVFKALGISTGGVVGRGQSAYLGRTNYLLEVLFIEELIKTDIKKKCILYSVLLNQICW